MYNKQAQSINSVLKSAEFVLQRLRCLKQHFRQSQSEALRIEVNKCEQEATQVLFSNLKSISEQCATFRQIFTSIEEKFDIVLKKQRNLLSSAYNEDIEINAISLLPTSTEKQPSTDSINTNPTSENILVAESSSAMSRTSRTCYVTSSPTTSPVSRELVLCSSTVNRRLTCKENFPSECHDKNSKRVNYVNKTKKHAVINETLSCKYGLSVERNSSKADESANLFVGVVVGDSESYYAEEFECESPSNVS